MEKFQAAPDRSKGQWAGAAGVLAECMTLLERYDEAERLLAENYKGFEACVEKCLDKVEARQRLVKLYDAWGKPEQAARFR